MDILIEFIPIVLIFLLVSYTTPFIVVSHSILGKILAISIIVYYTSIDQTYGLLFCLLIILYYQFEYVEELNDLYYGKLHENLTLIEYSYDNKPPYKIPSTRPNPITDLIYPKNVEISDLIPKRTIENFDADSYFKTFENPVKKSEFVNKNCKKCQLTHLGENVKPENADHVYPEIIFYNKTCNVCDKSCIFSIIDTNRLNTEELLTKPHDSNDWVSIVWDKMISMFPTSNYSENMADFIFSK